MAPLQDAELPRLKAITRLTDDLAKTSFFDVKFYPFVAPGVDPVFAMTSSQHTFICRPLQDEEKAIDIIRCFKDEDEEAALNSIAWAHTTEKPEESDPLICVSGGNYTIKILNVITGNTVKALNGHGGPVADLVTSPREPYILASASEDHSIRLWDLRPKFDNDPCRVICAGEGHKAGVLTVAFHSSGNYLLSGGFDSRINLWVLPNTWELDDGLDKAKMIHLPHFSTIEVHSDYVDCVSFYGDLILSKSAKENRILLWKITNFSSRASPPTEATAPTSRAQHETRSAFINTNSNSRSDNATVADPFQVLLTFDCPGADLYWMRFSLFHGPSNHPILAMGHHAVMGGANGSKLIGKGHVSFWDLQLLEDGLVGDARLAGATTSSGKSGKGGRWRSRGGGGGGGNGLNARGQHASLAALEERSTTRSGSSPSVASTPFAESKDGTTPTNKLKGALHSLQPHRIIEDPTGKYMLSRAVAWSTGGEWCVVVGDEGTVWVMRRWEGDGDGDGGETGNGHGADE